MQNLVFRADYIIEVFIINIGVPRVVAVFGFGACIGRSQNSATFKDSFADPRGLVGAVGCNDFVFGVMLTDIIIQRIKCYVVETVFSIISGLPELSPLPESFPLLFSSKGFFPCASLSLFISSNNSCA